MNFFDAYKKLDSLCKDIYENGISSYIAEMEQYKYNSFRIPNWDFDYKKLKKYRYVRNKLAHESNTHESDFTDEDDIKWLQDFYQRILERRDPLRLLHIHMNETAFYQQQPRLAKNQDNLAEQQDTQITFFLNLFLSFAEKNSMEF
ncbi:MAG: DUF6548 family protein [Clostridia bacterium]